MTKEQELWQTCLSADDTITSLDIALRDHKATRKKAYGRLYELYKDKTKKELLVIWDGKFEAQTVAYYQDESIFPDANRMLSNRNAAWRSRATSKKKHFINRMLGIKVRHGVVNDKASNDTLVSRMQELTDEIIVRHNDLGAGQMRNILRSYDKVLNVFHTFHKDEIKGKY